MIADALKLEVEIHAQNARVGNPLMRRAAAGALAPAAVGRYLVMLRAGVGHSPVLLERARERANEQGRAELADYFGAKLGEELGHEDWAVSDLAAFRGTFGIEPDDQPVPSMLALNRYLDELVERNPILYLAYILWAEYFPVLVGGEFVRALVERCDVPAEALTCLARHVELDQDHTEENLDSLDDLVVDPHMLQPLRSVIQRTVSYFDRACDEIVGLESSEQLRRVG